MRMLYLILRSLYRLSLTFRNLFQFKIKVCFNFVKSNCKVDEDKIQKINFKLFVVLKRIDECN